MTETKRCAACRAEKPLSAFSAKQTRCKECKSTIERERRKRNPQRPKRVRSEIPPEWPGTRIKWTEARANYRRWTEQARKIEAELAEAERQSQSLEQWERELSDWQHDRPRQRLKELRECIAELESKGMTPERAAVMEESSGRKHARKVDQSAEEYWTRAQAEREARRRDDPDAAKQQDNQHALLLLAGFLVEQQEQNGEAFEAAHKAALRAADRTRGNPADAYRRAFEQAYSSEDVTEAPLFQWPPEWLADPRGTLERLLQEHQRKAAARRYLARKAPRRG